MSTKETIIILLFLFMMITAILSMSIITSRRIASHSYILKKKLGRISWIKVFKVWGFMQLICLWNINIKDTGNVISILSLPILIMYLVLVYGLSQSSLYGDSENSIKTDTEEFKEYEKSFMRDKKINKIL